MGTQVLQLRQMREDTVEACIIYSAKLFSEAETAMGQRRPQQALKSLKEAYDALRVCKQRNRIISEVVIPRLRIIISFHVSDYRDVKGAQPDPDARRMIEAVADAFREFSLYVGRDDRVPFFHEEDPDLFVYRP